MEPISYTQIRTWRTCPRAWWMQYRGHVSRLQSEAMRIGCEVHDAMARIVRLVIDEGATAVDEDMLPEVTRLLEAYDGCVRDIVHKLIPSLILPLGDVGVETRLESDGVLGILDVVCVEARRIIDWKSAVEVPMRYDGIPLQAALYAGLVLECYGITEPIQVDLVSPVYTADYVIDSEQATHVMRYARALRERMWKLEEAPDATPGGHCANCLVAHACDVGISDADPSKWAEQYEAHAAAASACRRLLREYCATGVTVGGWGYWPTKRVRVDDLAGLALFLNEAGESLAARLGKRVRNTPLQRVLEVDSKAFLEYLAVEPALGRYGTVTEELSFRKGGQDDAETQAEDS